jgi:hypothetical protein
MFLVYCNKYRSRARPEALGRSIEKRLFREGEASMRV